MRALELGEKALAMVPQATAGDRTPHHAHHHRDNLAQQMHQRYLMLQRIIHDSYSSSDDSSEDIIVPDNEGMEVDENINSTYTLVPSAYHHYLK